MGVRASFPRVVDRATRPIGRVLAMSPLRPNHITTLGFVLTASAAVLAASGRTTAAGLMLLAGGSMDTFDGALARARGTSTPFGAFYDAVTDRMSDGVVLAGVAWAVRADDLAFGLALLALVTSQVTSYVRARAEAIDLDCSVGLLERTERTGLLIVGLLWSSLLSPVLWALAVGGAITVVQRIHHVWCQIDRDIPPELLGLTLGDRAWNRAFRVAARSFFGERNYEESVEREDDDAQLPRPTDPVRP